MSDLQTFPGEALAVGIPQVPLVKVKQLQHCTQSSWELALLSKNEAPRVLWHSQGSKNESKVQQVPA